MRAVCHLTALGLVILPQLIVAGPYVLTGIDPALRQLLEFDMISGMEDTADSGASKGPPAHLGPPPDPGLMELFSDDDEELRLQDKRSGLRAALVARGGRGLRAVSGGGGQSVQGLDGGGLIARRSQPSNSPYLSVGVLSNVEQYFNGLREQLETMADGEEGGDRLGAPPNLHAPGHFHGMVREGPRPSSTAAYLHALRSHRPSHRVRSFVEDQGPVELRGANSHDPALLWTGLGRR